MLQKAIGQIKGKILNRNKHFEVVRYLNEWRRKHGIELGDYLEFGCYKGNSAAEFYEALVNFYGEAPKDIYHMYLFDSFVGLPTPAHTADQHPAWKEGEFDVGGAENFAKLLNGRGVPRDRFTLVEGFYEESLPKFNWSKIKKASFVNMDCDYYSSTVTALEAVKDKLDNFSVIYFDDLHSFAGNPNKGQVRAIREFNEKYPDIGLSPCPLLSNYAQGRLYWVWRETTN